MRASVRSVNSSSRYPTPPATASSRLSNSSGSNSPPGAIDKSTTPTSFAPTVSVTNPGLVRTAHSSWLHAAPRRSSGAPGGDHVGAAHTSVVEVPEQAASTTRASPARTVPASTSRSMTSDGYALPGARQQGSPSRASVRSRPNPAATESPSATRVYWRRGCRDTNATSAVAVAPPSSVAVTSPLHVPATGGVHENDVSAPPGWPKPGGGRCQAILVTVPSGSPTDSRASSRSPTVQTKLSTAMIGGRFGGCVVVVGTAVVPTDASPVPLPPASPPPGQPVAATETTPTATTATARQRCPNALVHRPVAFRPAVASLILDKIGLELLVTRPPTRGGSTP